MAEYLGERKRGLANFGYTVLFVIIATFAASLIYLGFWLAQQTVPQHITIQYEMKPLTDNDMKGN